MRIRSLIAAGLSCLCVAAQAQTKPEPKKPVHSHENLGGLINSEFHEGGPVISPDGRTLYFWSFERPGGYGQQDIYYAQLSESGEWNPAIHMPPPLNNDEPNFVLSVTPNGNEILLYHPIAKNGVSDLAISQRGFGGWTAPKPIQFIKYSNKALGSTTASMAPGGKTLLISMENETSHGQEDLYVSFYVDSLKKYTEPKNLGSIINTNEPESTPFLAPDGVTLYFSSKGHGGYGGDDVFMSQRLDDSWTNWTQPKNLGPEINTPGDEYHFKFPASAQTAYMVSTGADTTLGGKDIYRVLMKPDIQPHPVFLVSGKVINQATKQPLHANVGYMSLPEGVEIGTAMSHPETGEYKILLPAGKNYAVMAEIPGYMAVSENLNAVSFNSYKEMQRDLYLAPIQVGQTIHLNNLFFETGKTSLSQESFPELQRLLVILQTNPSMKVEISGHTDNIGSEDVNLKLSQMRAEAVFKFLTEHNIATDRIVTKGYGSSQPVASNTTNEGRAQNRRVDFKIIGM